MHIKVDELVKDLAEQRLTGRSIAHKYNLNYEHIQWHYLTNWILDHNRGSKLINADRLFELFQHFGVVIAKINVEGFEVLIPYISRHDEKYNPMAASLIAQYHCKPGVAVKLKKSNDATGTIVVK